MTCPLSVPTAACPATVTNTGAFTAWLPSLDANYRIPPNWAVYGQVGTGSVAPPSAVYDYNQTSASASAVIPQLPDRAQAADIHHLPDRHCIKGNKITADFDVYHIRFQNSYATTTDAIPGDVDFGDAIFYLQPGSISKGMEAETTIILAPGLSTYFNGSFGRAYYTGTLNANLTSTSQTAPYFEHAPSGLWVAQTPTDTEMEGLTYQKSGMDMGIFNKRVGQEQVDGTSAAGVLYHNQAVINPFSSLGGYLNYTIRNRSFFDGTKIRLSGTNLLDAHNIQGLTLAGTTTPTTNPYLPSTDTEQFNATTPINGADAPSLMAGRSFSVSVTFGIAPRERK